MFLRQSFSQQKAVYREIDMEITDKDVYDASMMQKRFLLISGAQVPGTGQ